MWRYFERTWWQSWRALGEKYLASLFIDASVLGMPNSSGGAVVVSCSRLIGVHVSSCWHRASCGGSDGGSSAGGSSSSMSTEPPDVLEIDASHLWMEPDQAETPDNVAAQESYVNIPVSSHAG